MADRLRIYIASAISQGDLADNVNAAIDCFHRLLQAGLAPLCPALSAFSGGCSYSVYHHCYYAYAHHLPRGTTHADWMAVDLPWVRVADAVLRLPGPSVGADTEVATATTQGIPVFYDEGELLQWAKVGGSV